MHPTEPSADFRAAVHEALQLWAKDAVAGSPLAHLTLVRQAARNGNLRRATNQVLLTALQHLAADHEPDAALLRERYLSGKTVVAVANARNLAETTLYKAQRQAIDRLAATLLALEQQATADRQTLLRARLPAPTYDRLFGVEAHLPALRSLLQTPEAPWLVAIEGLGGIGKTALAHLLTSELAQLDLAFADVGWVGAQQRFLQVGAGITVCDEPALTATGLIETLVTQLMPAGTGNGGMTPERALNALEARLRGTPHLIVIDNLETISDVESLLPILARLARPSKFLLTAREAFPTQAGVYHFILPELNEAAALELVRHTALLHGLPHVVMASDDDLHPIYATVGGNPLALQLVTGQLHLLPLAHVLENLRAAQGKRAEELYHFIYWTAWQRLPAVAQDVLALLPLFAHSGADLAAIQRVSDLSEDELVDALAYLARLSLVNASGDLDARRYGIHRLTETFLLNEVIKWQGA